MTGKQSELINQIKSESSRGMTISIFRGTNRVAKSKFDR